MRLWALLLALFALTSSAWAQEIVRPGFDEIRQHQLQEPPPVRSPWRENARTLGEQSYRPMWGVRVTVDTTGAVTAATVRFGPNTQRDEVIAAARQIRFRPFERDARAVEAMFDVTIFATPADYVGPEDRDFPEHIDLSRVRIRFERHGCFGTCPAYSLDIRGDGSVTYVGEGYVLATGELHWRIPQTDVEAIIALMRRADFFRLSGHYELNASDLPTYITSLEIGDQRKYVLDYGGAGLLGEGTIASVAMGTNTGLPMPAVVTEIERAIDRLAGVEPYIHGDDSTIGLLRAARFDLRGERGGAALGFVLINCNLPLSRALLAEGAPITQPRRLNNAASNPPVPVVLHLPNCGDVDLAREFAERGALRDRRVAADFLHASAATGFPDMVRLALRYSHAVNATNDGREPPLMAAVDALDPRTLERDPIPAARFDVAETVSLLLRAGANARYRDGLMGWTPLHHADNPEVVRALVAAGADVNARDNDGDVPLFGQYNAAAAQAMIDAGADVHIRDQNGRTSLHRAGSGDVVGVLVAAGLEIEARDAQGRTPLETVDDEKAAQALLAAGASMPDDPERVAALVRIAQWRGWTELAPQFEVYARSHGVTVERQ